MLIFGLINIKKYIKIINSYKFMGVDIISDILNKIKLSGAVYFKSDFSAPWGINIPQSLFAQFHIVTRGQCVLRVKDKNIQLFAGDIIVLPLGGEHWLADNESSERRSEQEVIDALTNGISLFGRYPISATMLCGHFEFDRSIDHPLINELPEIIHITNVEHKELHWLESIVSMVIQEVGSEMPGSNVLVDKLCEVLFIHILRAFILNNKSEKGFMAAIKDKRISKVLSATHDYPERNWKLSSLAEEAGMSRTSFSNLFKSLMGETPLAYLTNWRMLKAKELLRESTDLVGEIAEKVRYQSEPSFNLVFKKRVGKTPLKYRQAHLANQI